MRKLLRVTFFFVLLYVGLCTTLPLRVLLLWPQMQWGFQVVESSGSVFSGYHLKLAKDSRDEKWKVADLFINYDGGQWIVQVNGVQMQSPVLKSLHADLEPLREIQTRIAELQAKPVVFEAKNLSLKMAHNWPSVNCERIVINKTEFNLNCEAVITDPELTLRLSALNDKSATLTLIKDKKEHSFPVTVLQIKSNELIFPPSATLKQLTLSFNFEGIRVQ
jgi:hypothetical protein